MLHIASPHLTDGFKKKRAIAKKTIRLAKRRYYWEQYCKNCDRFTPTSDIWRMIKRINNGGHTPKKSIVLRNEDGTVITDQKVVEECVRHFKKVHESIKAQVSTPEHFDIVNTCDGIISSFSHKASSAWSSDVGECFTLYELNKSLKHVRTLLQEGTPIRYEVYKNLSPKGKEIVLNMMNNKWEIIIQSSSLI